MTKTKYWLLATAGLLCLSPVQAQASDAPEVQVENGRLIGAMSEGVENYFGIPFAAPPTGDLRWMPPQPAKDWEGSRDASTYGSACPQNAGLDSVRTIDEDCLFLNVQRPEGTTADDKLPVLVMIHGGSWETGSGNIENLNALVRENNIIGVAVNYRLGLFGGIAHPALADGNDVGNYSLMDQQAALEWVKRNVSAFGGDPDRVTLGGESAGGGSVCSLMAAPSADGLFDQAILMSTVCFAFSREDAIASGEKVAADLGCEGDDAASCLRALPAGDLVDAAQTFSAPIEGTDFLPKSGWTVMDEGNLPAIPVMIGANRNEGRAFFPNYADHTVPTFDRAAYEGYVRDNFGNDSAAVLAVYPWPEDPTTFSGTYLVAELFTADLLNMGAGSLSACKTSKFTELLTVKSNVWAYEFAPDNGPGWFEVSGGYKWGTAHAAELIYIIPDRGNFATNGSALSGEHKQLSDTMISYWGNFVRNGNPNGDGVPEWVAYQSETGPVMQLREGNRSAAIPTAALRAAHNCDFWSSLGYD